MNSPKSSNDSNQKTETLVERAELTIEHGGQLATNQIKTVSRIVGPGVVTGASDDDPSGIGTYSVAGAQYGLGINWLTLASFPLMIAIQEIAARIGITTNKGLAGVLKQHSKLWIVYSMVSLLIIANTINIGADLGAMAAATQLVVPVPFSVLAIGFALLIVLLEVFLSYKRYANILKWLTLSLLAYFATALLVTNSWGPIFESFIHPTISMDRDFLLLVVGFLGTTISPYLYFWQASEEVEERSETKAIKQDNPKQVSLMRIDVLLGTAFSQLTTFFIVLTTAQTLHVQGITQMSDAAQAASALEPLACQFASLIFAIGIVGTGLLAIPVLAGSGAYAVAESFGWKEGLSLKFRQARGFYIVIIASTLIGLSINFLQINPIKALLYSAVVNGVIAVPLIALMVVISSNKKIMGANASGPISKFFGWLTVLVMGVASLLMIWQLF
jgi:NRAMP (natural resistance-associated macrophage protein)-like metal ion transporter